MTSSLVGSEMCIRDRLISSVAAGSSSQGIMGQQAALSSSQGSSNSHWAVSYTHLTLPTICSV
eukprot:6651555-Prorocentrum_lima.AAC.1